MNQSLASNSKSYVNYSNMVSKGEKEYQNGNREKDNSPPQNIIKINAEANDYLRVVVRVRPPLQRELLEDGKFISTIQTTKDKKAISIFEYYNVDSLDPDKMNDFFDNQNLYAVHSFTFDCVFDEKSSQDEVYENTAKPAVLSILEGYNATIFAYGQTGTGKTYTMEGYKTSMKDKSRGIIPRAVEDIYRLIEEWGNQKTTFMVRASFLQIYNENISDLLKSDRNSLQIREDKKKGVFVEGLSEWAVRSPAEVYSLIQKGSHLRATASTKMNDLSSRSHAVFIIIVEQMRNSDEDGTREQTKDIRVGKLNLVDLAGSERVRVTGAVGKRLDELRKINQSLTCLGNVISALSDPKNPRSHIPYRDSKLTRILEDSLGGNCKTTMMAMISPAVEAFSESLSTLRFANRAKNIKNAPIINEDIDQKALLRKYENELKRLRNELTNKNKNLIDISKITKLEEEKRRAEEDKEAALAALESRSKEFFSERDEKKKLENKIREMNSQVLVGGRKIEETPQFKSALEEQHKLIRKQYEKKLQDLEKERQNLNEDKAQVDKYKQLLLKQRDIMIALTTRLNERDESILQLQEELDAYDKIHRESEQMIEIKNNKITVLEQILKENGISIPKEFFGGIKKNKENVDSLNEIGIRSEKDNTPIKDRSTMKDLQEKIHDLNEKIKTSSESYLLRIKQLEENNGRMLKIINIKDEELKKQNQMIDSYAEIKKTVDGIIVSLSQHNDPQKLQLVAQDLLGLQKLIDTTVFGKDPDEPVVMRFSNRSNSIKSSTIEERLLRSSGVFETEKKGNSLNKSQTNLRDLDKSDVFIPLPTTSSKYFQKQQNNKN